MNVKLLTASDRRRLLKNGEASARGADDCAHRPVVKLFTPDGACTWLLTEISISDNDLAFGLCDLGQGTPEIGYVRISELQKVRGKLGLPVERDRFFQPAFTIFQYAMDAQAAGRVAV